LPTIALPAGDPPEVATAAARRYGARYIVGFGSFGRYPEALKDAKGFESAYASDNVWIYRLTE
jgi:hypothetical protein